MKGIVGYVFLLLMCGVQAAVGDSLRSFELLQVSLPLTVVVTHGQKPIAGIEVRVDPELSTEAVFTGTTDATGTVHIYGLVVGKYYLTVSHAGFQAGKEWIEVATTAAPKVRKRFDFQWADWSYQTRRIAGSLTGLVAGNTGNKLMDIAHPTEVAYPGVAITLKNAFSESKRHTVSDSAGAFLIDDVPDGIYILTVDGGMESIAGTADITSMVIDVTDSATIDWLPLQLRSRTGFELLDKR